MIPTMSRTEQSKTMDTIKKKKIRVCPGLSWVGGMIRQSTEYFQGSKNLPYDTIMIDMWYYTCFSDLQNMQHQDQIKVNYGL